MHTEEFLSLSFSCYIVFNSIVVPYICPSSFPREAVAADMEAVSTACLEGEW